MEEEIEEKLKQTYNFKIEARFIDFREYEIMGFIDYGKEFNIHIIYDARYTKEANINFICEKVDKEIINLYKRKEK